MGIQLIGKKWCDFQLLDMAERIFKIAGDFRLPSLD